MNFCNSKNTFTTIKHSCQVLKSLIFRVERVYETPAPGEISIDKYEPGDFAQNPPRYRKQSNLLFHSFRLQHSLKQYMITLLFILLKAKSYNIKFKKKGK